MVTYNKVGSSGVLLDHDSKNQKAVAKEGKTARLAVSFKKSTYLYTSYIALTTWNYERASTYMLLKLAITS